MQLLQLHVAMLRRAQMTSSTFNSPFMHVIITTCCYGDVNLARVYIYFKKSLADLLMFSEHLLLLGVILKAFMKSNVELPFM